MSWAQAIPKVSISTGEDGSVLNFGQASRTARGSWLVARGSWLVARGSWPHGSWLCPGCGVEVSFGNPVERLITFVNTGQVACPPHLKPDKPPRRAWACVCLRVRVCVRACAGDGSDPVRAQE